MVPYEFDLLLHICNLLMYLQSPCPSLHSDIYVHYYLFVMPMDLPGGVRAIPMGYFYLQQLTANSSQMIRLIIIIFLFDKLLIL